MGHDAADTSVVKPDSLPCPEPRPRIDINIREAVASDLEWIDELHKRNTKGLGFWHRARLEEYIEQKKVLIAEGVEPLGFIISTDKYKQREDVGCIYAVCVSDVMQRKLIGASLVKAAIERAAWGCTLFCCWCAQDLDGGYFWESLGFTPLAFRTGAQGRDAKKSPRVHIFWQKRIRAGDMGPASGGTPWWYPSLTQGGVIREGRLVLPIPPGNHWSDPKPMVLPEFEGEPGVEAVERFKQLDGEHESAEEVKERLQEKEAWREKSRALRAAMKLTPEQTNVAKRGGIWVATAEQTDARESLEVETDRRKDQMKAAQREGNERSPRRVYSEEYLVKARELCARYLEALQVPGGEARLLGGTCGGAGGCGKYEVSRSLAGQRNTGAPGDSPVPLARATLVNQFPLLNAA